MRSCLALVAAVPVACQAQPSSQTGARAGATPLRGTYVVREPNPSDRALRFGPGPQRRILYLNRFGGTFTSGDDDSSTNTSSIPSVQTATLAPFADGDAKWAELVACTRQMFAPFDVTITETDPGATPHIESVVAGLPEDLGLEPYLGIATMYSDCSVVERAIVFTFPGPHQGDVEEMCATVAQESAHALGLDHELECLDPMTYRPYCGPRSFQDRPVDCGEDTPRACTCGGTTQNSHAILLQVLGPADGDALPPLLSILRPQDGELVPPAFEIEGEASDSSGVERVTLFIDGAEHATDSAAPYVFTAPDGLAPGPHAVELRAFDTHGNVTPRSIEVTLDGEDPGGGGEVDDDPGGGGDLEPPPGGEVLIGTCAAGAHRGRGGGGIALVLALLWATSARRRSS